MNVKKIRSSLIGSIVEDLLTHFKLPILLLIMVVGSAFAVLSTTQNTRILLHQREQLRLEKDALDNEWRNLQLEERVLLDGKDIELQAIRSLGMKHVTIDDETVVIIKKK